MIGHHEFKQLEKAELHVHLEGSLQIERVLEFAASQPNHAWHLMKESAILGELKNITGFPEFIQTFMQGYQLLTSARHYQQLTEDLLQRFESEGVVSADVLYSPGVAIQNMGVCLTDIHDGIEAALAHSRVNVRFVLDTVLNLGPTFMANTLDRVLADRRHFLRGFSVGGGSPALSMEPFLCLFERAQHAGLFCLAHAGEVDGPLNIHTLLDNTDTKRIAHGCRAVEDPSLLKRLSQRDIAIEVCLSSNRVTGVVPDASKHPVCQFEIHNVPYTLSTDDPFYFQTDLYNEYQIYAQLFGFKSVSDLCANSTARFEQIT